MKVINSQSIMEFHVVIKITESEARALEALVGYGFKPFRDTFYKHMGEHYMKPHEKGLEALFDTFWKKDWWAGGFLWKWYPDEKSHEGHYQRGYTPQGKLSEKCIEKWYK